MSIPYTKSIINLSEQQALLLRVLCYECYNYLKFSYWKQDIITSDGSLYTPLQCMKICYNVLTKGVYTSQEQKILTRFKLVIMQEYNHRHTHSFREHWDSFIDQPSLIHTVDEIAEMIRYLNLNE